MGQAIVITSGKGGAGKSTLVAGLGREIAAAGKRVALVDMDMGMRSLDLMLGVQDRVVYDLADVADGISRLKSALIKVEGTHELYVLNAAQTRGSDALTLTQVDRIIRKLKEKFDWVLIDCPAGVGRGFRNAASGADSAILVVLPDGVSVRGAERVVGLLEKNDIRAPMLVVNRVPADGQGMGAKAVEDALHLRLLGWIPDDPDVQRGRVNREMKEIARRVMGEDVPIAAHRKMGYFRRLGRALRGR